MSYVDGGDTPRGKQPARQSDLNDELLLAKFNKWDSAIEAHWGDWRGEARTCFAMVAGQQIDAKTKGQAEDQGIAYVTLNKIDATVSAICGSEINGRQEVKYYPREMSQQGPDGQLQDAKENEILTGAAEWARDECDAAEEESQAFRDCITCGIGLTETRMDYEEDPEGMPKVERVDPLEMSIDPSTRRPNAVDARYLRRRKRFPKAEAEERFGIDPDVLPWQGARGDGGNTHENYPASAYQDKDAAEAPLGKDEIEIDEYQWYETVKVYLALNPQTQQLEQLDEASFQKLTDGGVQIDHQMITQRRFRRAFRVASQLLEVEDLPDGEFTYKFVTGKHDRNKGVWYGVVRAMIDPQRLMNKMVSQVQRIIDHNAKGGLLAEENAFLDRQQAEDEWARSDSIVWVKDGALGGSPKVLPKPASPYPSAIDRLMMLMDDALPGVSGVNKEMLGLQQGTDQAGILDYQRKQASYAVLAGFFDSLRRYRKLHGRFLLKLITKYISDGRLIRIVGQQGNVQYVKLIRDPNVAKYDVIVDEAPAGPNQKERTFAFLQSPFGAQVMAEAPQPIQLKLLEYTPLPMSLVSEIQEIAKNLPPQQDPAMAKAQADAQAKQMQMQSDQQVAQAQLAQAQQESAAQLDIQRQSAALKLEQQRDQAQQEGDLAWAKAHTEAALAQWKAEQELALAQRQMDIQEELDQRKLDSQHAIGMKKAGMSGADVHLSKDRPGGALDQ